MITKKLYKHVNLFRNNITQTHLLMRVPILSFLLCVMVAVESTTIKYVQKVQGASIPSEQLVFLVEIFKLCISVGLYLYLERKNERIPISETSELLSGEDPMERKNSASIIWFILPACLYAISNNVTFAALMLMSPALFNLLMNLKIPLTGLMACSLLSYKLTKGLAVSFLFLFVGSIFATLRWDRDGNISVEGSIYGLLLMFVYATCSAGAAVYTEYVTKTRYPNESVHLQNIKFCICSAVANVFIMLLRGSIPYTTLRPIHLASVAALGANGLITAAVLKFAGSIVKTYAVSCAAFLSAIFTLVLFHQSLHWNFYVGGIICALSVNLYLYEKGKEKI